MKDPLKQGLKHRRNRGGILNGLVEVKDPLKQGLKPLFGCITLLGHTVEVKDPLKQAIETHVLYNMSIRQY